MKILTGIQPSGKLHLGNYFGAMRPALDLQAHGDTFLFIANYHAMTTVSDANLLREQTLDVALDFLAAGLDIEKTAFYRQSDIPEVHELAWLLSCHCPMGLLERCHSYKDKLAKGFSPHHSLFAYPMLMAADILIMNADKVPVGRDQKQHLEVTRDVANKFNLAHGEVFTLPNAIIQESVAIVPGIDGQKMSKSYDNTLELFGDPKKLKKRVMKIVTDSKEMDESKDPATCNVFSLMKLLMTEAQLAEWAERYRAGGMGYGHAKKELLGQINDYFAPMRAKRIELENNLDFVEETLQKGAAKARTEAATVLDQARRAVGLS